MLAAMDIEGFNFVFVGDGDMLVLVHLDALFAAALQLWQEQPAQRCE